MINHFLARLDLDARLDRFVPTRDRCVRVPYGKPLGVLVRSILVEREPIYLQQETVSGFAPECFGLSPEQAAVLSDDADPTSAYSSLGIPGTSFFWLSLTRRIDMKTSSLICSLLVVLAASGLALPSLADPSQDSGAHVTGDAASKEFSILSNQIDALAAQGNFDGLKRIAADLGRDWDEGRRDGYFQLMTHLCNDIGSKDFMAPEQYELEREYAQTALNRSSEIPFDLEFQLLMHLQYFPIQLERRLSPEDWSTYRAEWTTLWLRAWKKINAAIDDSFDPNELPLINVPPPASVDLPAGVASEEIKDPDLRHEYEAAIQKNIENTMHYNEQIRLRKSKPSFLKTLQRVFVYFYSRPGADLHELDRLLNEAGMEKAQKADIMKQIASTIA